MINISIAAARLDINSIYGSTLLHQSRASMINISIAAARSDINSVY